jgi:hypothetical protein
MGGTVPPLRSLFGPFITIGYDAELWVPAVTRAMGTGTPSVWMMSPSDRIRRAAQVVAELEFRPLDGYLHAAVASDSRSASQIATMGGNAPACDVGSPEALPERGGFCGAYVGVVCAGLALGGRMPVWVT